MSDNAPERIWIEEDKLLFVTSKQYLGIEYIRKDIADKRLRQSEDANKQILQELIDSQKGNIQEILQPIRDVQDTYKMDMTKFDEVMTGAHDNEDYCEHGPMIEYVYSMIRAIKDTLERSENVTKR